MISTSLRQIVSAVLIAVFAVTSLTAQDTKPRDLPPDYASDKCSFFFDCNYAECCVVHDKAYFFGGTKKERRAADAELYRCVRKRRNSFVAGMMWLGVRIGGVGFLPTPFRWGFGKNWKPKKAKIQIPVQKSAREQGLNAEIAK